MNQELQSIIIQYQEAVAHLFPRVVSYLNISLPVSNIEWAGINAEQRGETLDGVKYFIHGYGIAMNDGNVEVDFDLGDKGQINGFDAWRLFDFVQKNNLQTSFKNEREIDELIKRSEKIGEIEYSGYILYYFANYL